MYKDRLDWVLVFALSLAQLEIGILGYCEHSRLHSSPFEAAPVIPWGMRGAVLDMAEKEINLLESMQEVKAYQVKDAYKKLKVDLPGQMM